MLCFNSFSSVVSVLFFFFFFFFLFFFFQVNVMKCSFGMCPFYYSLSLNCKPFGAVCLPNKSDLLYFVHKS